MIAVHHDEHAAVSVPSRRELFVSRKEGRRSRMGTPEVELAPRERRDGSETLRVERKHLQVVPFLEENVVRRKNLENARRNGPWRDGARGAGKHDEEPRDEREPGSGHPGNGISLAPDAEKPRRNVHEKSPKKRAQREKAAPSIPEALEK